MAFETGTKLLKYIKVYAEQNYCSKNYVSLRVQNLFSFSFSFFLFQASFFSSGVKTTVCNHIIVTLHVI